MGGLKVGLWCRRRAKEKAEREERKRLEDQRRKDEALQKAKAKEKAEVEVREIRTHMAYRHRSEWRNAGGMCAHGCCVAVCGGQEALNAHRDKMAQEKAAKEEEEKNFQDQLDEAKHKVKVKFGKA
jgi:hypothetical protein